MKTTSYSEMVFVLTLCLSYLGAFSAVDLHAQAVDVFWTDSRGIHKATRGWK